MNKFVPYGMLTFCKNCGEQNPYHRELTDEEIGEFTHQMALCCQVHPSSADINVLGLAQIVKDIIKKVSEK